MGKMWQTANLNNESDVELKFLMPLLTASFGLNFSLDELQTKRYLREFTVGKRSTSKGHVPDIIIDFDGIPLVIIEAKHPRETLDEAIREARQYALHLNGCFPTKINPVETILVTNGVTLIAGPWDSDDRLKEINVSSIGVSSDMLALLRKILNPDTLRDRATKIRNAIASNEWRRALTKIGSTPLSTREKTNYFAAELLAPITKYLSKDLHRDDDEIVRKAYVSTSDTTSYEKDIENLLRDSLSRELRPEAKSVVTKKNYLVGGESELVARRFDTNRSSLTLLIGGVGSGKSILVDRFFKVLVGEDRKKSLVFLMVDFNFAPKETSEYRSWVRSQLVASIRSYEQSLGNDPESYEFSKKIFSKFIGREKRILCGPEEGAMSEADFDLHIRKKIVSWLDDPDKIIEGAQHHYSGERQNDIVLFLDNSDKRNHEEQLAVFQNCVELINDFPCACILAMRDETYDIFHNQPPLDTIAKPRILRVAPPRLIDVLSRRVELMCDFIEDQLPDRLSYFLDGGAKVEYGKAELKGYVMAVFSDLFGSKQRFRNVLESVAGRNVRRSMEMFISVLRSPHLINYDMGYAKTKSGPGISSTAFFRTIMRGTRELYDDNAETGFLTNILQTNGRSSTSTNLLLPEFLSILLRERRRPSELNVQGYVSLEYLMKSPELLSFSRDDILWASAYLFSRGLVVSDASKAGDINPRTYFKISASGFAHLRLCLKDIEYFSNVAMSTWVRGDRVADQILNSIRVPSGVADSPKHRGNRCRTFIRYLEHEIARHQTLAQVSPDRLGGVKEAKEAIKVVRSLNPSLKL